MNRQLKIWKEDFLRFYKRTSIIMRVIIGAVLSGIIAYFLINNVIKKQNAELKTLKQKFNSMEVADDVEIQTADLQNKQRKAEMQLNGLKTANELLSTETGALSKGEVGKNILDLRFLIDSNQLRIVSEERVVSESKQVRRRRVQKKVDTGVKISFPASMSYESYKFEVLGSYQSLRKFFMDVRNSQSLFFLNNVRICQSKEMLTDKNFNQYRALSCSFEVHVPYKNENIKQVGAKK